MIPIAAAYRQKIMNRPLYKLSAYVYKYGKALSADDVLGTGADFELLEDDFFSSGNTISAESTAFPAGNAVCKACTLTINASPRYAAEDFAGAHLVLKILAHTGSESFTVTGDYYFVQTVTKQNGKIVLECADLMSLADKPYKYDVEFTTSAGYSTTTIYSLFTSVTDQMGLMHPAEPDISPDANGLVNAANLNLTATYSINTHRRFENGEYTCRQVLEFIAMATGSNIIADDGALMLKANPLFYIKTVDGASQYVYYGHELKDNWLNFTDEAEEIKITGVECTTTKDIKGRDITPTTYKSTQFSGKYILDVSDNPFYQDGEGIDNLYGFMSAPVYRKFSGMYMGYPLIQYGDYISAVHLDGTVKSFITDFEWNISGGINIGCNIESGTENASKFTGGAGAAISSNQDLLDSITEDDVTGWSAAATKAEATKDYITEQGVSGKWTYRKWASGAAECWSTFSTDVLYINTAWGSLYYGTWMNLDANKTARAYPFAFIEDPIVETTLYTNEGDGWLASDTSNNYGTLRTHAPAFCVVRPTAGSFILPRISYHVTGKWK